MEGMSMEQAMYDYYLAQGYSEEIASEYADNWVTDHLSGGQDE